MSQRDATPPLADALLQPIIEQDVFLAAHLEGVGAAAAIEELECHAATQATLASPRRSSERS